MDKFIALKEAATKAAQDAQAVAQKADDEAREMTSEEADTYRGHMTKASDLLEQQPRFRQQLDRGSGGPRASGRAGEQQATRLRLELAQLLGERHLRNAGHARGGADAAVVDRQHERAHERELHDAMLTSG